MPGDHQMLDAVPDALSYRLCIWGAPPADMTTCFELFTHS
jgi:hypothetical protein